MEEKLDGDEEDGHHISGTGGDGGKFCPRVGLLVHGKQWFMVCAVPGPSSLPSPSPSKSTAGERLGHNSSLVEFETTSDFSLALLQVDLSRFKSQNSRRCRPK